MNRSDRTTHRYNYFYSAGGWEKKEKEWRWQELGIWTDYNEFGLIDGELLLHHTILFYYVGIAFTHSHVSRETTQLFPNQNNDIFGDPRSMSPHAIH